MRLKTQLILTNVTLATVSILLTIFCALIVTRSDPNTIQTTFIFFSFFLLGLFGVTIFIIMNLADSVSAPLLTLKESAKQIAHGDYDHEIQVAKGVEDIRELAVNIEILRKEVKLQQELVRCESARATVASVASHIAHDMRSPLAVLHAYFRSVNAPEDQTLSELHSVAEYSLEKLKSMVTDLFDSAKAHRLNLQLSDMESLINDAILESKPLIKGKAVSISATCHRLPHVLIDPLKIQRVLTNLIQNSIQAIDTSEGEIRVQAKIMKDSVALVLSDTGPGITKEDLPKIFRPDFTKGKKYGTGFGLAFCKQVIEAHGGCIEVESEVGVGTSFHITVPIKNLTLPKGREDDQGSMTHTPLENKIQAQNI